MVYDVLVYGATINIRAMHSPLKGLAEIITSTKTTLIGFYVWECDLLSLTKGLYLSEYEIKISLADFKADMKKEKHQRFTGGNYRRIPNYLWYVISGFKADMDILPEYAGLMTVDADGKITTIQKAPLIHKRKIAEADYPRLLNRACKRLWGVPLN